MKINDLTTLTTFKTIYETRSLTKSSEIMALSKAALSKRLEALELDLGFKLFSRTTRSMAPTLEADRLFPEVQEILEKIQGLSSRLEKKTGKRTIRVTCISSMSQRFMGRMLLDFQKEHPLISIELIVTDSVLDFVENNIDLAIRVNPSKNSSLVGRKLGEYRLVAVANKDYPVRKKIQDLDELIQHPLLVINAHMMVLPKTVERTFTTNDSPLINQLLVDDVNIGIRSSWDVKELVKEKKLKYVLPPDFIKPLGDIWLLSDTQKLKSEEVRKLNDYLFGRISKLLS
jgi:DNA-binding transcriptional LysR family regulator